MERQVEATLPLEEWCGEHRTIGSIAGKPGAWRNRSQRCEHHVDRSVTRCFMCEPYEKQKKKQSAPTQRSRLSYRAYSIEQRTGLLKALAESPMRLMDASERIGLRGEPFAQLIRVLRDAGFVRLDNYSMLSLTHSGRIVYGGK